MNIQKNMFLFTGDVQTYTIPKTGLYELAVYGASGGNASAGGNATGGKGGYAKGQINLEKGQVLTVVTGGTGGYNCGGSGQSTRQADWGYVDCGSGGGASFIALSNHGTLNGYSDYTSDILIVAAGGGGAYSSESAQGVHVTINGGAGGGSLSSTFSPQGAASVLGSRDSSFHINGKGGGGAGYQGGAAGNGGYSYIKSTLTNTSYGGGENEGNGFATISMMGSPTVFLGSMETKIYQGSSEIASVYLGNTEVYTNGVGTLIDLGKGQSFNIKNILPDIYSTFTADNFYVYYIEGRNGGGGSTSEHMVNTGSSSSTLYKSYNATTGILTCYNQMQANWRASDQTKYGNKNTDVKVKLFVPNMKIGSYQKVVKAINLGQGQTFNVSSVYSGYKSLTADDFYISTYDQISYGEHTGTSGSVSVYLDLELVKEYNNQTGVLNCYCHSKEFNKERSSNVYCWILRGK